MPCSFYTSRFSPESKMSLIVPAGLLAQRPTQYAFPNFIQWPSRLRCCLTPFRFLTPVVLRSVGVEHRFTATGIAPDLHRTSLLMALKAPTATDAKVGEQCYYYKIRLYTLSCLPVYILICSFQLLTDTTSND